MGKEKLEDTNLVDLINYEPTKLERLWWDIQEFFVNIFSPKRWKTRLKFFWQRRIRGFDDSETWALDESFFRWFLPRLKRFAEITICYPDKYESVEDWTNELNIRIKQLEKIVKYDIYDEYSMHEYDKSVKDFLEWFKDNIQTLWW